MAEANFKNKTIFEGDNLDIMRGINSECIDLIYLDPPFNTKNEDYISPHGRDYGVFKDIVEEGDLKREWLELIEHDHYELHTILNAARLMEGGESFNFRYLAYMAIRLIECHRVLKDTGSIYLHCDPTMSHYLKLVMDCIFGEQNFRNEIVWCYTGPGSPNMRQFNRKSDTILWYNKGEEWVFNADDIRVAHKDGGPHTGGYGIDKELSKEYGAKGKIPENWWQIRIAPRSKNEYVKYPTQKPLALLERIIAASSNEGDLVLDPFCGCATTCVAAELLNRDWIGIDVSPLAYDLVKKRLKAQYLQPRLSGREKCARDVKKVTKPPKRTDGGAPSEAPIEKYVYVISNSAWEDDYKVGIAANVQQRLNQYQTSDPNRGYKIEHTRRTYLYKELEKYIHKKFDRRREWVRGVKLQTLKDAIDNYKAE